MKKNWIALLAVVGTLSLTCGHNLVAQDTAVAEPPEETETLPAGKDVLAKHVEAIGGAEKMRSVKTTLVKGKFQMPAAGLNAPMTITFAAPQKVFFDIEIPGMGKILKGTDGTTAWEVTAMSGPRIIEGAERDQFMREADPLADLHPEKYFKSVECTGKKDIDGKTCFVLEFTGLDDDDEAETRYYDAETYLHVKTKQIQHTPMGNVPVESMVSDYRDVGGMKMAHKVEISMMGQKQVIQLESVELNGDVPDSTFDLPDEIKELQAAAEAESDESPAK